MENLEYKFFSDINLNDSFFNSLKEDYKEFSDWFIKKQSTQDAAYVLYNPMGTIEGFMYLKYEQEPIIDVNPPLPNGTHLKIGTFKFESAGTRRGERFIKKMFDIAFENITDDIYVTIFPKHEYLTHLFIKYGFIINGIKESGNGTERVLTKILNENRHDVLENYPRVDLNAQKYTLALHPTFHSRMLPDSILNNESHDIIKDVSSTNSIHKIYLCKMFDVTKFRRGDLLIIYRTGDGKGPANYRSVITSLCVVEEIKDINEFPNLNSFLEYSKSYSIFEESELIRFYNTKEYPYIIKFTYNTALKNRVTRERLINEVGISSSAYAGVIKLTDTQFRDMLTLGNVNERFIIN